MAEQILRDFMMILVTIDPIGTLSIFVPITGNVPEKEKFRVAKRAVFFAGVILFAFLIVGQIVLSYIGVKLVSFQLAGGIVLFIFSLQMIFGTVISPNEKGPEPDHDPAIFPLAIPSIASPGSIMAVVLLTDNNVRSYADQGITALMLLLVLIITLFILRLANPIYKFIGNAGSNIMIRVMGLILAALATQQILEGITNIIDYQF